MYNFGSSPTLINVVISGNKSGAGVECTMLEAEPLAKVARRSPMW